VGFFQADLADAEYKQT